MSKAVDNEALGEEKEGTRYYLYKVPFRIQSMSSETEQMSGEQYRMSGAYSEAEAEHLLIVPLAGDNAWASAAAALFEKHLHMEGKVYPQGDGTFEVWVETKEKDVTQTDLTKMVLSYLTLSLTAYTRGLK